MAHITLRLSTTWSETLLHRFDLALDRLERAVRSLLAAQPRDLGQAAHAARVRRLTAHGCSGQALM
ncbi:MAG TPA: hypothetical protein VFE34_07855 [Dongiaceae bacterium]|jgi:hypothetical protein|nr:hypothetical protein [Dongiaceae bacterium]